MRDGERDEITCGRPGATQLDLDPIDEQTDCTYAYLKFSRVARVYTSRDGAVRVRVTCFSSLRRPCHGAVRLRPRSGGSLLATGPFHLEHQATEVVELKIRSAGRTLARRRGSVAARLVAVHQFLSDPTTEPDLDSRAVTWVTRR